MSGEQGAVGGAQFLQKVFVVVVHPVIEGVFLGAALGFPFRVEIVEELLEIVHCVQKSPFVFTKNALFHAALHAAELNTGKKYALKVPQSFYG